MKSKLFIIVGIITLLFFSCASLPTEPQYGDNAPSNINNPTPQTEVHNIVTQFLGIEQNSWSDRGIFENIKGKTKKVLVVGWDGVRLDSLILANTPAFDEVVKTGYLYAAYAGGDIGTETEQLTVSGPGWTTLLTGTWANSHNFTGNSIDQKNPETPSFLQKAVEAGYSTASSVTWNVINNNILIDEISLISHYENSSDTETMQRGIEEIAKGTDVVFVALDDTDIAGHSKGYYPEKRSYLSAIEENDKKSEKLIEAIRQRETFEEEAWLVVFSTDHGGHKKSHGGQSQEERDIYIALGILR